VAGRFCVNYPQASLAWGVPCGGSKLRSEKARSSFGAAVAAVRPSRTNQSRRWFCATTRSQSSFPLAAVVMGRHCTARHGNALPCTARHRTARHRTARHRTARHRTERHCTERHCTAPHRPAPHCTAPHRTALHRPAPPCTALHRPAPPCTALQSKARGSSFLQRKNLFKPAAEGRARRAAKNDKPECAVKSDRANSLARAKMSTS
jgi:hypothetical protein